jgi:hypothetical protein
MGLQTNPTKTKAMVCAPNPTITRICSPAYKRRMEEINNNSTTEPLPTYSERKRQQIECKICHARLQARSIARHKRLKHGTDISATTNQTTPPHLVNHRNTYEISMPEYKQQTGVCPVPGCSTVIKDRYGRCRHFLF